METTLLIAQLVATGAVAAWLSTGLRDNLLHPALNETYTAEVLGMMRMQRDYPEAFTVVAHRAITSRRSQQIAFRAVVATEALACLLLWTGVIAILMALAGTATAETARVIALLGATSFTAIWVGFLVVGNYFYYWFCHEAAQNTHFQMTLWGLGTMILISLS